MGKFWRDGCCSPLGSCWTAGTSASAQPTFPGASTGAGSNPPSQQALSTLVQGLILSWEAGSKDVSKFEAILKLIEQILEKHRSHTRIDITVPDIILGNLEDADTTFKAIYDLCKEKDGYSGVQVELQKVLRDAFGGLGSLHWITAAFSMVASVLKRIDNTRQNKENCLNALDTVGQLGRQLVPAFERMPDGDKLWQIASSVVEVIIVCTSQLDDHYFTRFAFVNVAMGNISALEEKIRHLYRELNLSVAIETLGRTSQPLQSYDPENPTNAVGRDEMVGDILKLMQQSPQTCEAILLHGIGGIGKTTIGRKIIAECQGKFRSIAMVEIGDIGDDRASKLICKCQSEILERLRGRREEIGDSSEGRKRLQEYFNKECSNPVLIFIDNVFEEHHLTTLLPAELHLPCQSYILLTSRYAGVSKAFRNNSLRCQRYRVDVLEKSDASILLKRRLGGCPEEKRKEFETILRICNGWPLAIQVVGGHLNEYRDDAAMWEAAITKLKECKSLEGKTQDQLVDILKWSFTQVDEDTQNVFLDIACLLRNEDWAWAEALGSGLELKILESRSLLKRVEKQRTYFDELLSLPEHVVEVHDLLVALVQQKSTQASRAYSIDGSLPSILEEDCHEAECEHVQGLFLDPDRWEKDLTLSAKKLDAMCNTLRILRLGYFVNLKGECQNIPKNLRICSTVGFPYKGLKGLENLRVLQILGSSCNVKFNGELLPKTLRILHLQNIHSLERFHESAFTGCSFLHTVHIELCSNLKELPANICDIRAMRVLRLFSNQRLRILPSALMGMEGLEDLKCSPGTFIEFPSEIADLKALRALSFSGFKGLSRRVDLSHLSQLMYLFLDFSFAKTATEQQHSIHGFGELCALQSLHIVRWENLTTFCDDLSKLTALKVLSFERCRSLTQLPEGLQNMHALSVLNLQHCRGLQSLPYAICQLLSLEKFYLTNCTSLKRLPEGLHKLVALSKLKLLGCSGLENLPDSFSQLSSSLEYLDLRRCTSLREIPRSFGNWHRLRELKMTRMDNVEQFPNNVHQLTSLRHLAIPGRSVASSDFSALKSLRDLEVSECGTLTKLPAGVENIALLEHLTLKNCTSLTELPSRFWNLVHLRNLRLTGYTSLTELPYEVGNLLALKSLRVSGCVNLQQLSESLCGLKNLWWLELEGTFESLPDNCGDLNALTYLRLSNCPKLKKLPNGIGSLLTLVELKLTGCEELRELPNSVCGLTKLRTLELEGSFEKLPERIGNLRSLTSLRLSGCRKLKELPDEVGSLPKLTELCLGGCEDLHQLPESLCGLNKLIHLELEGSIGNLLENFGDLSALSDFRLHLDCRKPRALPDELWTLPTFQDLRLRGCQDIDLQQMFDKICGLKDLDTLALEGSIERLPENFGDLESLFHLNLSGCPNLVALPESMIQMKHLGYLYLPPGSELGKSELIRQLQAKITSESWGRLKVMTELLSTYEDYD